MRAFCGAWARKARFRDTTNDYKNGYCLFSMGYRCSFVVFVVFVVIFVVLEPYYKNYKNPLGFVVCSSWICRRQKQW